MNTASENVFRKEINKELIRNFNSSLKKQDFSTSIPEASENICFFSLVFLFFFSFFCTIGFLWSLYWHRILFDVMMFYLISTRVNQRKIKSWRKEYTYKLAVHFDQWKTFFENYKPMRVWLWLSYQFTENYYHLRLFSEFIQTQMRYPTSPEKVNILTWKLLTIPS